jgi:hypothetical protein
MWQKSGSPRSAKNKNCPPYAKNRDHRDHGRSDKPQTYFKNKVLIPTLLRDL